MDRYILIDLWRMQFPETGGFTLRLSSGSRARLDFILSTTLILPDWKMDKLHYCPLSDHSLVIITYCKHRQKNSALFKPFPTFILRHPELRVVLETYTYNLCSKLQNDQFSSKWKDIKHSIRLFAWELVRKPRPAKKTSYRYWKTR